MFAPVCDDWEEVMINGEREVMIGSKPNGCIGRIMLIKYNLETMALTYNFELFREVTRYMTHYYILISRILIKLVPYFLTIIM